MKRTTVLFVLFASILLAQRHPVIGESYTIKYSPTKNGILNVDSKISVVYVFDYWGTLPSRNNVSEEMFQNVLAPTQSRVTKTLMKKNGSNTEVEIIIPDSVALLSYYFTDGTKYDYNNKKTYTEYIYGINGKPVKGARYRSIDFMVLADASLKEQSKRLEEEIKDYPDNFIAHYAYWIKEFDGIDGFKDATKLKEKATKSFKKIHEKYPNNYEALNFEGKVYYYYLTTISRVVGEEYKNRLSEIIEICEQIPEAERSSILQQVYESYQRKSKSQAFNDKIVKKEAPDFEFTTIDGKTQKLSDFKGKYVLLDFWGTWCGPCVGEIPNLKKNYEQFKSKGFEIISISSDLMMNSKTKEEFESFIKKRKMNWTHILESKEIINQYSITNYPTLYLLDKNGKIIHSEKDLRGTGLEKTLEIYLN